ncbi:unnamed protein product [Moneuplotes crassus]|uniref:C2H2-type domain-containing protein n=1 Tax=Euplotes crassus TaxID=5936 RepID=A0AAD1UNR4_EUPCR|nr:unnamed protein product [Moneuplotes crassus]
MKTNLGKSSNNTQNSFQGDVEDTFNDKENKKNICNIARSLIKNPKEKIKGLKTLNSDHFLNNFEDIRTLTQEASIPRPLEDKISSKHEESKYGDEPTTLPTELLPLNQMIQNTKISEIPEYSSTTDYKRMFWEVYSSNQLMLQELQEELGNYQKILANHLDNLKTPSNYSESFGENIGRKKHIRRTSKEITKNQNCPYQGCGKVYGSEGSLNLHMKLKHGGGNKTDREKLSVSFHQFVLSAKLDIESSCYSIWQPKGPSFCNYH